MFAPYSEDLIEIRDRAPMPVTDFLRRARARIADPARWCQGTQEVRDKKTYRPIKVCSIGALKTEAAVRIHSWTLRVASEYRALEALEREAQRYLDKAALSIIGFTPKHIDLVPAAFLNDSRSHKSVMAMWDKAIAMAERAGA